MPSENCHEDDRSDFAVQVEREAIKQLKSQRVGFLLGAGTSYLDGHGYPLSFKLWELVRDKIDDEQKRDDIQAKLDDGAQGIEQALDLLDDGGAQDTPYRHLVTEAIARAFQEIEPPLETHVDFLQRLSRRGESMPRVFSLNYDPLLERAAERAGLRLVDGFWGIEHAFFDASIYSERVGYIRGNYKGRKFEETQKPIRLFKLHGSLGWYECPTYGVRRCAFDRSLPLGTQRLMVPPQRRKAADTASPPYSTLWSLFRGCLTQNEFPLYRLACLGYGFADEHVNAIIDGACSRTDFSLLIFVRSLQDYLWDRWSSRPNVIIVTRSRCSLKGEVGPGHPWLWGFESVSKEI